MSTSVYRLLVVLTAAFWGSATLVVMVWLGRSVESVPSSQGSVHQHTPTRSSTVRASSPRSGQAEKSEPKQSSETAASVPNSLGEWENYDVFRPRVVIPKPAPNVTQQDLATIASLRLLAQATDIDLGIADPSISSLATQLRDKTAPVRGNRTHHLPCSPTAPTCVAFLGLRVRIVRWRLTKQKPGKPSQT